MSSTKRCMAVCAIALSVPTAARGQEQVFSARGIREYVDEVLHNNSEYAAARSRVLSAAERIAPAGALPDPELTIGLLAAPAPSFDFTAERMTRLPIGVRQRFPFPGKQAAATNLARADSVVFGEAVFVAEARVVAEAAAAYYDLAYARTALDVWRARTGLADQAIAVAQVRYETGAVSQTDLLRARLRRAELVEEGEALAATVDQARARADALRGGRGGDLPTSGLITLAGGSTIDVRRDSLDAISLQRTLLERNPDLRVTAALVRRAERSATVFDVAGRPDFTVTLENGIRFGGREPLLTALVGVSVPLWSGRKQTPAARGAHLDVDVATHTHGAASDRLTGELHEHLAMLRALGERAAQTSNEILPLAEATSASALQRYRVGALEFSAVLDTQDALFRARLRLARLIADYGEARARLAALVGEEWYR